MKKSELKPRGTFPLKTFRYHRTARREAIPIDGYAVPVGEDWGIEKKEGSKTYQLVLHGYWQEKL